MSSIKTPDQRVRVFVSSTLQELEKERKVAREAINTLRLIPVLFESGARPHPPRELYRAYLEQSHVFVGIYWKSYGWVAPGMQISGLEDEFRLSSGKARLIYVKNSVDRQLELSKLLHDIQDSDSVTYQKFNDTEEFRELLENDLALLLSERFEVDQHSTSLIQKNTKAQNTLPFLRSTLIGREKELKGLHDLLFTHGVGLVTLTGAGGTGKSRLALELAHDVKVKFSDGVYFVSLASISDPLLVIPTIARALGLYDTGQQPIRETLIEYLLDKNVLILLDNFEHVIVAGPAISELLSRCQLIKIIVTSRAPLRIRDEHIFPVSPLGIPVEIENTQTDANMFPSVKLFIERAREVNPGLQLSPENMQAINEICRKLDGLPLAIELAAARVNVLTPTALLTRMGKLLDILSQGRRDLPQRHQTIRATIGWSYNLLDEKASFFFRHLAVFSDGWTLVSSDIVINANGLNIDVLEFTDRLINAGLIQSMESSVSSGAEPRFTMLQTVREYAFEILNEKGEAKETQSHHAAYFVDLMDQAQNGLWYGDPIPWLGRIDEEYQNISAAFFHFLDAKNTDTAWKIIGSLLQYWTSRGRFGEAFRWMELAGVRIDAGFSEEQVSLIHQGKAILTLGTLTFLSGGFKDSIQYLQKSIELFKKTNNIKGIARAKTYLGAAAISLGNKEALVHLQEAIDLSSAGNDEFSFVMSSAFLGEIYTGLGEYEKADYLLTQAEEHSRRSVQKVLLAVTLLQKASYYLMQDDYTRSLEACRESIESFISSGFKSMRGWAHNVLGQGYLIAGDPQEARHHFADGIACGREAGDKSTVLYGLIGFSSVALVEKNYTRAAILLGAAETMIKTTGYAFWSTDKKFYQLLIQSLTEEMSEAALKESRLEGEKLLQEKAIAMALN